ncbi:CU044_2847 family protein [Micromonospora cathayae]|uniref:CU044_2847 family protein n=1 Tax=Micromonospora cathayae TaxID=3028804 RepID=A0ABY7ZKI5_9ACTN|nr:CU044_2847 family protein [Micromonospora sp. HUAS 3]WDZ83383.1 CU044_2847 family protein [Micromonospora sp. HUAS 3]
MVVVIAGTTARGGQLLVDVEAVAADDPYADVEVRGERLDRLRTVGADLVGDGLDLVKECAQRVSGMIATMTDDIEPDELEVQVAVKLDYSLGAVLVGKGTAGAQLQVTMRWNRDR